MWSKEVAVCTWKYNYTAFVYVSTALSAASVQHVATESICVKVYVICDHLQTGEYTLNAYACPWQDVDINSTGSFYNFCIQ